MTKTNNGKTKWIWLSVLILFVCVAATSIAFVSRLDSFLLDDEGAIPLVSEDAVSGNNSSDSSEAGSAQQSDADQESAENGDESGEQSGDGTVSDASQEISQTNPGFEASDEQTVWSTDTKVEIFRVSYVNGEAVVTVNGDDGDKLIAPGTENSYTFKLKNTGDVALKYNVEVDAYFTPADIQIPVSTRLNRYDGKWIVGGKEEYANVPSLDAAEDGGKLGAGKYTYYTLDWTWPFERGEDELDTALGNLATEQDLIFTIVIKTTATENSDPDDDSGITPPQTGDNTKLALWITLAVSSFAMMAFLLFFQIREKRRENAEADKN